LSYGYFGGPDKFCAGPVATFAGPDKLCAGPVATFAGPDKLCAGPVALPNAVYAGPVTKEVFQPPQRENHCRHLSLPSEPLSLFSLLSYASAVRKERLKKRKRTWKYKKTF